MIDSLLNQYFRKGDFQAASYFFLYYEKQLTTNQKLLWQTKILFHQGLYEDALKHLNKTVLNISILSLDAPALYYCYLYKILIKGLVFNKIAIGLRETHEVSSYLDDKQPRLQGFSFEVRAKLTFLGVKLQLLTKEKYKEGLFFLEQAMKWYQLSNATYQYYSVHHLLLKQLHEYEGKHATNKVFTNLRQQLIKVNLPIIEAEIILSQIRLDFIIIDSSVEIKRLNEINHQTPYFLGQGKLFLLKAKTLFKKGDDGRHFAQKAIYLFKKLMAYVYLIEAWNEYSLQSIHFSNLKNASLGYLQSLAIAQKMGIKLSQAHALMGIGESFHRMGEFGQSILYYETAQELVESSILTPLLGMNLANIYDQMNLKTKAIDIAQSTVSSLKKNVTNPKNLSLAYYILGNILVSSKKWKQAKQCWSEGLVFDQKHAYYKGVSEKWTSMGWTVAQEIYHHNGLISKEQLEKVKAYYIKAINVLQKTKLDQEKIIAEAQIYQTFAHILILAKNYDAAFLELDKARELYEAHHLNMQAANTLVLRGLIAYQLAQQLDTKYWGVAFDSYKAALVFFETEGMKVFTWRINYYLADIAISISTFLADNQLQYWLAAEEYLRIAHFDIQAMRQEFKNKNILETDAGRLGLIADKSKVYILGVKMNISLTNDYIKALHWLEALKSRALIDSLQTSVSKIQDVDSNTNKSKGHLDHTSHLYYWKELKKDLAY